MIAKRLFYLCLMVLILSSSSVFGLGKAMNNVYMTLPQYVQQNSIKDAFRIVANGNITNINIDADDWAGVLRAADDLGDDIGKVSGMAAKVMKVDISASGAIIVGTIGKSKLIDRLIAEKKIDVSDIKDNWESFLIQTVDGNLVVAGSDKRGTIFGVYDISEKIGVSPWYWWADVPVKKSTSLYVKAGKYIQRSPKVKYRGIFINDEWPSFGGWASNRFGGLNSKMYSHLFELLLRLKANYFWPAMWATKFNEDDALNPVLADEYGIIMGTSHHEPMMRAHKEYTTRREKVGPWNYATNKERLDKFFTEGLERNKAFDNLITIGMRGDGDVAMGDGSDEENMKVLTDVVKGQRDVIQNVYGKQPSEVPQTWAIFTEVQRYYDKGFTVPDDVLLMFCDNNWGYIRRIGPEKEKGRIGGMGLYYHIDMNGGPWNDRWVNTTTVPKIREQLNLAYLTGLDDLWIINVGDLKPKELPVDFIMRYAWNPDAIPADKTGEYTVGWATAQFGPEHAEEIADIVSKYSKYNLWRKPEVQSTKIFSIVNHREADRVIQLWRDVAAKAESLQKKIASEAQDAYYQLVLYPAKASAGVAEIYLAAAKNNLYAKQGRISANDYVERVQELFEKDKQLSDYYNRSLANGKWKNMMSDVHIGYTQWSMPEKNILPELKNVIPLSYPAMGVAIEGCEVAWPFSSKERAQMKLPIFDILDKQSYYIDIFNRGIGSFQFGARSNKSWVKLSTTTGTIEKENRILVSIDWKFLPEGSSKAIIEIKHKNTVAQVLLEAVKTSLPETNETYFGSLTGGEFSIPANEYHTHVIGKYAKWVELPGLGREESCVGIYPVTAPSAELFDAPQLEYKVFLPKTGKTTVCLGILPTQDIYPERGLRIAMALDDETPQVIDARKGFVDTFGEYTPANLSKSKVLKSLPVHNKGLNLNGIGQRLRNEIFDNLRWLDAEVEVKEPGMHTLKVLMVDPEVVLERIVVNPDNNYPSYFGAPTIQHNVE